MTHDLDSAKKLLRDDDRYYVEDFKEGNVYALSIYADETMKVLASLINRLLP